MVKPYRIKHKASGYFYQRYNGSNLGKSGKVYMNNQSPLTMCDNGWIVTRGDGTQRIEALYECYDKIEWLDFDELK